MNAKVVVSGVLTVGLFAVAVLSPIGGIAAMNKLEELRLSETRKETYSYNLQTVESTLVSAANSFNESRTFDVYYGDIPRLQEVFSGIAGITVSEVTTVDPMNGFTSTGLYSEGVTPAAVKFNLVTDDPVTAIGVIEKMQLPIYELSWQEPNSLFVIFLVGGGIV